MAYGIPRRAFGVNDNEQALINWRRGLFRVWVLMSAAWLMGWMIFLMMQGVQGRIADHRRFPGDPSPAVRPAGRAAAVRRGEPDGRFAAFKIEGRPAAAGSDRPGAI